MMAGGLSIARGNENAAVTDDGPAPPYTVAMKEAHLARVRQSPYVTPTASADARLVIGTTRGWQADDYPFDIDGAEDHMVTVYADFPEIPSHPLYGFRITDPETVNPAVTVVLTDGSHNTEHTGSWAFEGMIDFLLGDDPRADALRRHAVFTVYPMVNPDGRFTLVGRCNPEIIAAGWLDHNRMWHTAGLVSTIDALVPAMRFDTGARVDYALDFHSTSSTFIFSLPELKNHPYIQAITNREPETGPRRSHANRIPGNTRCFFAHADGLAAPYAWTPEHANSLSATRSREFGRVYALALYDVLLDGFEGDPADDVPAFRDPPADPDTATQALLTAAAEGDVQTLETLLDSENEIGATDRYGNTALHLAAANGHAGAVRFLLTQGASPDARNQTGRRPLYLATAAGHGEAESALLAQEEAKLKEHPEHAVEAINRRWRFTALHRAAGAGERAMAGLLLQYGAGIDARDIVNRTPLRHAAEAGHDRTAAFLIEQGADVNARDSSGNTALHLAAIGCRPHSEHWATICRGDCRKRSALCPHGNVILCKEEYIALANVLLEKGAAVSAANRRGWTPLHYAARYDRPRIAALLIEHGADIHAPHAGGDTPLHVAAAYNRADIVAFLLDAGANPAAQGGWNRTPMDWARQLEYPEVMNTLETFGQ